jgi:hypothetical protein
MIVVLLQAAETDFHESEDALQDAKRVLTVAQPRSIRKSKVRFADYSEPAF